MDKESPQTLFSFLPAFSKKLVEYKGADVVSRLGENAIKEVVNGILHGKNVRSLTEGLTRQRIATCSAGVLTAFVSAGTHIHAFSDNIVALAGKEYNSRKKLAQTEKMFLLWLMGLTKKGVDNVLRGDVANNIDEYVDTTRRSIREATQIARRECGELAGTLTIGANSIPLSWNVISQLFTVIGAQTLAIRGSEKSIYGKMFEKLVLGTLLSILGFRFTQSYQSTDSNIFWLSQREDKRESDATVVLPNERGMRFDIGFIGPGNPEISLDKVSRFERQMEFGSRKFNMGVIILIDKLGKGSRTETMARSINGHIIQMCQKSWLKEVVKVLHDECGFKHNILNMSPKEIDDFITEEAQKVDIKQFFPSIYDTTKDVPNADISQLFPSIFDEDE